MHELEQVVADSKKLGKLEDEQKRRTQFLAITILSSFSYLGIAGISGLTGQNLLRPELIPNTILMAYIVGAIHGGVNVFKLAKIDNEIKNINERLVVRDLVFDKEKPKRKKYKLGDDGELFEVGEEPDLVMRNETTR